MSLREKISNQLVPPVFGDDPSRRKYADQAADAIIALVLAHATSDEAMARASWAHMEADEAALAMLRAAILAALGDSK